MRTTTADRPRHNDCNGPRLRFSAAIIAVLLSQGSVAAELVLPVQRVVLSTAGVGYFQHGGQLNGAAQYSLPVSSEGLNDLLKSLRVDGGAAAVSIDYPGAVPLARQLAEQGVDLNGNPSLTEMLLQLRGESLTVHVLGGEQLKGRVLGVEQRPRASGDSVVEVPYLLLVGEDGIRALALDQILRFEPGSPRIREQLTKALSLLSEHGRDEQKNVLIHFNGDGARSVSLAYVIEAPVWKSSYRLDLGMPAQAGNGKASARLQGWAIVDNATPHDWQQVELALVSGRPLSFIEALYPTRYVNRPEYTPANFADIAPQVYGAEVAAAKPQSSAKMYERSLMPAPPAPAAALAQAVAGEEVRADFAVQPEAQSESLGATFQFVLPRVTLASQRSALLPLFEHSLTAERVSIYERAVLAAHPLHGVRLHNDTDQPLPGGPITVFEGTSYAGDARLDHVPAGGERLLSFAVDLDVSVQPRPDVPSSQVVAGRVERGVLHVQHRLQQQAVYAVRNESDTPRQLIIVHPQAPGWELAQDQGAMFGEVKLAQGQYRVSVALAAGEQREVALTQQRVRAEQVRLLNADETALLAWSKEGRLSGRVRAALQEVADLRRAVTQAERAAAVPQQRMADITAEQERIRANVQVLESGSQLHQRLVARLNEQETELEQLTEQLARARQQLQSAQEALETHLAQLSLE